MQAGRPLLGETMQVDQSFVPRYTKHITITSSVLPKTQLPYFPPGPCEMCRYVQGLCSYCEAVSHFICFSLQQKPLLGKPLWYRILAAANVAQIRPRTLLALKMYEGGKLSQLSLMSSLHNGYIIFLIFRSQIYSPPHAPHWRRRFLIYYFGKCFLFSCLLK